MPGIKYFVTRKHSTTIDPFLEKWSPKTSEAMKVVPYEEIDSVDDSRRDVFIFSDIDRIDETTRRKALALCDRITAKQGRRLVLNHPGRVLLRFQLLDLLWKRGINDFRVYPAGALEEGCRYPVFLRRPNDHKGPETPLLNSGREYRKAVRQLKRKGRPTRRLIAVEYCDTVSPDRVYRKYSSFRIGPHIVPGHVVFSDTWVAKQNEAVPPHGEEKEYLDNNPHRPELMEIFELANIEYGRIDYSLKNGRIQVWEINTNPLVIADPEKFHPFMRPQKARLAGKLEHAFLSLIQDRCIADSETARP